MSDLWINNEFLPFQSILKAYLRGVWDSIKGVSLIFIVIRDTYSSTALQNDKQDIEVDESSSSSNNTHTNKRPTKRTHANKRELNKFKEYAFDRLAKCKCCSDFNQSAMLSFLSFHLIGSRIY